MNPRWASNQCCNSSGKVNWLYHVAQYALNLHIHWFNPIRPKAILSHFGPFFSLDTKLLQFSFFCPTLAVNERV